MAMINSISAATSALKAFEKKLGSSANNIANIRTQGFKKRCSSFQQASPQNVSTSSGVSQVGRGTTIGKITEKFSQGPFEFTSSPTDMAIGGDGFFVVRGLARGSSYTRDGQFQFDKDGRLVTTSGYVVQGWKLEPNTGEIQGSIQDITLSSPTSFPEETTVIKNIVNLNAHAEDNSVGINALAGAWDGDNPNQQYVNDDSYNYKISTNVYDGVGASHNITLYFDRTGNSSAWEYIATADPEEDRRPGATGDNLGLLARGTLVFDDSGAISDVTMDINDGTGNWITQNVASDLMDGHFVFYPDFLSGTGGSTEMSIQLDFGSFYDGSSWVNDAVSSTQYSSSSNTVYASANGYGSGSLESIAMGTHGVLTGRYSNGRALNLFQVALARFNNPHALKKMGNNLYARTAESGDAITGQPGTNGLGAIRPNALEQSNVDLEEEFVSVILTKRGFQANLKAISAEDEMLGNLLNIIS